MKSLEMLRFVSALNELRRDFNPYIATRGKVPRFLVDALIAATMAFRDDPVTRAFADDVAATCRGIWDFSQTRAVIDATGSTLIIGALQNPYNELLGLDCLIFEELLPDAEFLELYPGSFARVIALEASSEGFSPNSCVALFGEHFVTPHGVEQHNRACYFVDRFMARYNKVTKALIGNFLHPDSLPLAREAKDDVILRTMCVWLHMHEYSHRTGHMPLPKYLDFKTHRDAASIEELRVDVLTVLACYEMSLRGHPYAAAYAEIVFTERCFRYAVQYDINQNYDARGCAILFNWLISLGVIKDRSNRLVVAPLPKLAAALQQIISTIDSLEETLAEKDRATNVEQKTGLVRSHLDWRGPATKYVQHPLMRRMTDGMAGQDLRFAYAS
jgi:hypothetical protein